MTNVANTYALIDENNRIGNIVTAESLEAAEELFLGTPGVVLVLSCVDHEGNAAVGGGWDPEKEEFIIPDEFYKTPWTSAIVDGVQATKEQFLSMQQASATSFEVTDVE
jgi:hypothetical protein